MSLLGACQWLAETRGSAAFRESLYMYPLVESIPVLTLCLFVGMAVLLDLRLLGFVLPQVRASEMTDRLLPWMRLGFAVMVLSGVTLFYCCGPSSNGARRRRSALRSGRRRGPLPSSNRCTCWGCP